MVHAVSLIALIALLYPIPRLWRFMKRLVAAMQIATIPEVYKRLHSEEYLDNLERTRTEYWTTAIKGVFAIITAVFMSSLWAFAYMNAQIDTSTTFIGSVFVSGVLTWVWFTVEYPSWLFNFSIDLDRATYQINLENVSARLQQLQVRKSLADAETLEEMEVAAATEMEVIYLESMAEDYRERLRHLPNRFRK